ncbi:MAG: hypothetical protein KIS66_16770 [Fimbriimonadaceae bacterium]|nr:hypothetical protein [Fimbriimonadaceae bacterium]
MKLNRIGILATLALAGLVAVGYSTVAAPQTVFSQIKQLIGADYRVQTYQFLRDADISDFTYTEVDGGDDGITTPTTVLDDGEGGISVAIGATENEGVQYQHLVESVLLTTNGQYRWACKASISSATQSDFIAGLCITDTTLLGGMTDGVYLRKDDGDTALDLVVEKDSTEVQWSGIATFDTSAHEYAIIVQPLNATGYGQVTVLIDGVRIRTVTTTNLPYDEALTPSIAVLTGEAGAITMVYRYVGTASPISNS